MGAALAELGYDYLGVDAVHSCVEAQAKRYPNLRIAYGDCRTLASDVNVADGVVDFGGGGGGDGYDVVFDKGTADALFLYNDPDKVGLWVSRSVGQSVSRLFGLSTR